jgi:hypothetical protein
VKWLGVSTSVIASWRLFKRRCAIGAQTDGVRSEIVRRRRLGKPPEFRRDRGDGAAAADTSSHASRA